MIRRNNCDSAVVRITRIMPMLFTMKFVNEESFSERSSPFVCCSLSMLPRIRMNRKSMKSIAVIPIEKQQTPAPVIQVNKVVVKIGLSVYILYAGMLIMYTNSKVIKAKYRNIGMCKCLMISKLVKDTISGILIPLLFLICVNASDYEPLFYAVRS